jgi:Zn-dependent M28 family amino/carboxypeptidase
MIFSPRVRTADLAAKLRMIVGERSPFSGLAHLQAVETFVEQEFRSYGLAVESDPFTYRGRTHRNIIASHGTRAGGPLIILGAHLDSVPGSPGADDNASGLAVLLETARLLAPYRCKSQILFCAFNLEEMNMIGSGHFAHKLRRQGVYVAAMVSLEMVGFTDARSGGQRYPTGLQWLYPDRGDFIGLIGNWRSYSLLRYFARSMRRVPDLPVETLTVFGNGLFVPEVRLSDHSPFWDAGYPALLITDTSFYRNPHYHQASDTIKTLDLNFMAKVCRGVITAVLNL